MREKTTLSSQNEKRGTKGKKTARAALSAALLITPMAASAAQETNVSEKNQDKKEIVAKTPIVAKEDSTITWDDAVNGPNLEPNPEGGKISQEEIQEYFKNHKEDLIKNIKDENLDKETKAKLLEELTENEKIQEMLEEMINRDDIRQAVLEENEEYIKQEISKMLEYVDVEGVSKMLWYEDVVGATIVYIIGLITGGIVVGRWKKD